MQNSGDHSVEVMTPPAWWWRQRAAALLEAQRQSPLDVAHVKITLRRVGFWRPGQAGHFTALYRRSDTNAPEKEETPPGKDFILPTKSDLLWLCGAGLVVIAAALLGALRGQSGSVINTAEAHLPADAPHEFLPVADMINDLSAVLVAAPHDAHIATLRWTPHKISLDDQGLDLSDLRSALARSKPDLEIVNDLNLTRADASGGPRD